MSGRLLLVMITGYLETTRRYQVPAINNSSSKYRIADGKDPGRELIVENLF